MVTTFFQHWKAVEKKVLMIYEINHIWTAEMKWKWSSQWTQFMQLRKEAWKKFRTSTGFEPVTDLAILPVRCSSNWAMKPLTFGAGQLWVHMFPWKKWVLMIYEISHIWTAEMKWEWRNDRRSERNLCNCVKKSEKKIEKLCCAKNQGCELSLVRVQTMEMAWWWRNFFVFVARAIFQEKSMVMDF